MVKTLTAALLLVLAVVLVPMAAAQTTPVTHSIILTWQAPVYPTPPPPTQSPYTYNIYKYGGQPGQTDPPVCASTPISSFVQIAKGITPLTYSETGIPQGVTRCYYVTTVDATGVESDPSTVLSVLVNLPVPTKPPAPTGFLATVK